MGYAIVGGWIFLISIFVLIYSIGKQRLNTEVFFKIMAVVASGFLVVAGINVETLLHEDVPASSQNSNTATSVQKTESKKSDITSYVVSISCEMESNDHVGNEWSQNYTISSTSVTNGQTVNIKNGSIHTFYAQIIEADDGSSDIGEESVSLKFDGKTVNKTFQVVVYENGGRYKGNCAEFNVTVLFTPKQ